ncbi:MAG: hypothetical protein LAO19_20480, partial [Acidobacteriia bacterium]|nr:hypothetical protein [Terriglobia bacterium]
PRFLFSVHRERKDGLFKFLSGRITFEDWAAEAKTDRLKPVLLKPIFDDCVTEWIFFVCVKKIEPK